MSYQLSTEPMILSHAPRRYRTVFFKDTASDSRDESWRLLAEARLRSGDYFSTLATELEILANLVEKRNPAEADQLRSYANELLYLDKQYALKRR